MVSNTASALVFHKQACGSAADWTSETRDGTGWRLAAGPPGCPLRPCGASQARLPASARRTPGPHTATGTLLPTLGVGRPTRPNTHLQTDAPLPAGHTPHPSAQPSAGRFPTCSPASPTHPGRPSNGGLHPSVLAPVQVLAPTQTMPPLSPSLTFSPPDRPNCRASCRAHSSLGSFSLLVFTEKDILLSPVKGVCQQMFSTQQRVALKSLGPVIQLSLLVKS